MRTGAVLLAPLVLALACTPESGDSSSEELAVEAGAPPRERGNWRVKGGALWLADGALTFDDVDGSWPVATDVVGLPSIAPAGDRVAYARQAGDVALSSIEVMDARAPSGLWLAPRVLVDHADRPAISPDGEQVAFVSGRSGIASLWLVAFDGGDPIQLTNRDLASPAVSPSALDGPAHPPGQPPPGFVPPPHTAPPRFEGDRLVWDAPDGPHEVALP